MSLSSCGPPAWRTQRSSHPSSPGPSGQRHGAITPSPGADRRQKVLCMGLFLRNSATLAEKSSPGRRRRRRREPCYRHDRTHPDRASRASARTRGTDGTLVQNRGEGAAARRRRRISRRGHPRRHQGAAAIGRELCRRLPGRPGVAPARRAGRRAGHHVRARRPSRNLHQRSLRRGDARRLDQLSAARRRHLEVDRRHQCRRRCAVEPRLAGRDRRRHDHHRRGLWRGRERHPGTLLCLRDEILDVAHRSAAGLAHHRALRRGRLRALRGEPRPGDAGAAHPRLPCHRIVHREEQPRRRLFGAQPSARPAALRLRAPRPSAGDLRARAAQGREPDAGGAGASSASAGSTRSSPAISTRSASSSWAA